MNDLVFNNDPEGLKVLIFGTHDADAVSLVSDGEGILYVKNINSDDEVQSLPYTAFHELRVASLIPVAGWTFNYNVNTELVKTTIAGAGTVTQSNSKALLQTGASASSSAAIETRDALRYIPGIGARVRFTAIFTTGVANSTQIIGVGDDSDGFFFGYNGTSFGILRRQNGVAFWTPQTSWNMDKFDGTGSSGVTLDTTKGNVYSIDYQWLGFGAIDFMIENPSNGESVVVNRIEYANQNTLPSVFNPTLPVSAKVTNTTNTSNITLQTPSAMAFLEGVPGSVLITMNSISGSKTAITTETAVLTIRNKSIFQTKTNRVRIRFDFFSCSADGPKFTTFKVIKNATLTGTSYTSISANTSVVEYDTAGAYSSGGQTLMTFQCLAESLQILLDSMNLMLAPGDWITVTASASVGSDVSVSFSWRELF